MWFRQILVVISSVLLTIFSVTAQVAPPEVPVKSSVLMDAQTGQILASKEMDQQLPPASITKLMTAYVTFDALKSGKIALTDMVPVSQEAYSQTGSRMFIEINTQVSVDDLIQGMIVQSGNDACVALAQYIGGSVEGFVQMMNADAKKLGLTHTHYTNVTGMPDDQHYSSAHDIAVLARAIIREFPEYYHYYSQKEFTWNKITQPNRNRLLWKNANVDGLKTGHTQAAGYCLAASEKRGDIRLITVVLGADVENDRYTASQALLNYGFSQFKKVTPIKAGQILTQAEVFKGENDQVDVAVAEDVTLVLPVAVLGQIKASVTLDKVVAPLNKGDRIGQVSVTDGQKTYATVDAVVAEDVPSGGVFTRGWDGLKLWWDE